MIVNALILHGLSKCAFSDPVYLRWKTNFLAQGQHQFEDLLHAGKVQVLKKIIETSRLGWKRNGMCDISETQCNCVMASPKHSGPSNPHRPCDGHLPKNLLGNMFGNCQVFSGEQTLRSSWKPGECLPASQHSAFQRSCWNNHSQGRDAPGDLALILYY